MKFNVDYEGEVFEYLFVSNPWDLEQLSFSCMLGERPLIKCWVQDHVVPNEWINVPRIDVLKSLMLGVAPDQTVNLRFRSRAKSPIVSSLLSTNEYVLEDGDDLGELSVGDLIVVRDGSGAKLTFHADTLLQAIQRDAENGICPFEGIFLAEDADNKRCSIQLTREVWMKYLLRGHSRCGAFLDCVTAGFENLFNLEEMIKDLHRNNDLWLRIKCFHYDLTHFEQARSRLEGYGGEFYMSSRYFSDRELVYLLGFPTVSGGTARQALELMFATKGPMQAVCASHDLAPALERIYQIRKGYEHEKSFAAYFKKFVARKTTY